MLSGRTVLVGITGGIAAYKACELIRMYKRANANVKVICTPNALEFVTKLTLQNLSQNEVAVEQFNLHEFRPEHISFAEGADIMVIAPATANTISKIARGVCDNLLTSVVSAFPKPIIIAPAMNTNMLENPIIQENLKKLSKTHNYFIVEPESGFLSCGAKGRGRLAPLERIFDKTIDVLNPSKFKELGKFAGKKIVITAGGTIEDIDPVRYISNYSSGKMGFALADVCYNHGAEVVLITTKDIERPYRTVKVKSALQMKAAVEQEFTTADVIAMVAAVADYRPKFVADQKLKKSHNPQMAIELVKNPDILTELSDLRNRMISTTAMADCAKDGSVCDIRNIKSKPILVGFCAETENLIENAKEKIKHKGCDFIVANDVKREDIGFSSDYNEVYIVNKNLDVTKIDKQEKTFVALKIAEEIYEQTRFIYSR